MTEPPYNKIDNQRPKYINELKISWSGVPLFDKKMYLVKANSTELKLQELQAQEGVIDFPNADNDLFEDLPQARKDKNILIAQKFGLKTKNKESTRNFINRVANSETDHGWDKNEIIVM